MAGLRVRLFALQRSTAEGGERRPDHRDDAVEANKGKYQLAVIIVYLPSEYSPDEVCSRVFFVSGLYDAWERLHEVYGSDDTDGGDFLSDEARQIPAV